MWHTWTNSITQNGCHQSEAGLPPSVVVREIGQLRVCVVWLWWLRSILDPVYCGSTETYTEEEWFQTDKHAEKRIHKTTSWACPTCIHTYHDTPRRGRARKQVIGKYTWRAEGSIRSTFKSRPFFSCIRRDVFKQRTKSRQKNMHTIRD